LSHTSEIRKKNGSWIRIAHLISKPKSTKKYRTKDKVILELQETTFDGIAWLVGRDRYSDIRASIWRGNAI
jgi:hypothetical protein